MYKFLITVFLLAVASPVFALSLSIEDAEKIFVENNIEIKSMRAEIKKADAEVVNARLILNPSFNYNIESIKNSQRETEETYSVTQGMNITGSRKMRIESAMKKREALEFFIAQKIKHLISDMKKSYYKILFLKQNEKTIVDIIRIFDQVEQKTKMRLKEGDVSELEVIKISTERKRLLRDAERLRADIRAEKNKLLLFLNLSEQEFDLSTAFRYSPVPVEIKEIYELTMKNRSDIKGQSLIISAAEASLSAERLDILPSIEVTAGYKRRTEGFKGVVFGVSIPLPVFNKNQGGIARAYAELEGERLSYELTERSALNEASTFYQQIKSLEGRIKDILKELEMADEIVKIVSISYEEGESILLDLLEAFRSYKEVSLEYNNALFEYWLSVFELERALGIKLVYTGGTK